MSGKHDNEPVDIVDPTGRHIRRRGVDDRGERFPIIMSKPVNARGTGPAFQQVWQTENMERARWGHVMFSMDAQFDDTTRTFAVLALEVNVLGYVGSTPTVLFYTTIDPNGMGEFQWDEPDSFSSLAFEVRQNIDGVNTSSVTGITVCTFNVLGNYWR